MPMHFREAAANLLTNPQLDPYAQIAAFKISAVRIEPAGPREFAYSGAMRPSRPEARVTLSAAKGAMLAMVPFTSFRVTYRYIPPDFLLDWHARSGEGRPRPGDGAARGSQARLRAHRRPDPRPPRRRLRHRSPHLGVGQLGQQPAQAAGRRGPRVRRRDRGAGPRGGSRGAARRGRPGDGGRPYRLRPLPPVPPGRRPPLPADPDHRSGPRRRLRRLHRDARLQRDEARRHPHRDRRHHGPHGQRGPHRAGGPGAGKHASSCSAAARSGASRSGWRAPRAPRW